MFKCSFPGTIAAVIFLLFGVNSAFGQCGADGTQPCKTTPKKVTPKKVTPKKTTTKSTVTKPKTAAGNSQTNPRTQTKVSKVTVLPLAIQLRLLTVDEVGRETEVNPQTEFTPTDRLRLSLKANQRGYLYVIRQKSQEDDGEIIFPTQLVNNGSNYLAVNKEYILPSNCPKNLIPSPIDCSLTLLSAKDAPMEFFTVIFTRDSLVDLPNDVSNKRVSLLSLMSAGKIPLATLVDLIEDLGQDLVAQKGDTPFAVRIINTNVKDNEEIIETFVLGKKQN